MKRYIKEMANDVQREIDNEIKALNIPFGELAEIGRNINIIIKGYKYNMLTDRDAVYSILVEWDHLKELKRSTEFLRKAAEKEREIRETLENRVEEGEKS